MQIEKRNGEFQKFNLDKVINAIARAMAETELGEDLDLAYDIAEEIKDEFEESEIIPTVESVQDRVEELLSKYNRFDVARAYILYRNERKQIREKKSTSKYTFLTEEFLSKYKHKPDPFPTELGKFVYYRTYSRPIPEEGRREKWWETVSRVVEFNTNLELIAMKKQGMIVNEIVMNRLQCEAEEIYDMIYNLKLFPSGRSLWIGNTPASYASAICNFNCSFVTMDDLSKFAEVFLVLMLGTGVGISVERKYVNKLPPINSNIEVIHKDYQAVPKSSRLEYTELKQKSSNMIEITIGDSRFGWHKAVDFYFDIVSSKHYSDIEFILFNYDNIRPAGERLKTFGGTASGFNSIKIMFEKINNIFTDKKQLNQQQWQKIKPIDCLDISTIIAENVVSGSVRRSAEIIFCDSDDKEVLEAKSNLYYQNNNGEWISNNKLLHRMLSNNTVLYNEKPTKSELVKHFELIKTSGEPSFGNMQEMLRRRPDAQGGNPCMEIILRDRGLCNLTEINMMGFVNPDGTYNKEEMLKAQRLSGKMGYRMASVELELHEWDVINKEDRLIGCSLTGIMDFVNATNISHDDFVLLLQELRDTATNTAYEMADKLNMNRPKLVTTLKPSGSVSQLPTVSSGIHYSHSPYYIRRVRVNSRDPLAKAMADSGFKWYPEVGQTIENHTTKVFEFPVKSPKGKTKYDVSAIEQLELYKLIMEHYVDHNASNTIHVRSNEWDDVTNWVYDNWDSIVGVTFLSLDDSFYQLMPYEAITEDKYKIMLEKTPKFNPNILRKYESFEEEFDIEDSECESGVCPIR